MLIKYLAPLFSTLITGIFGGGMYLLLEKNIDLDSNDEAIKDNTTTYTNPTTKQINALKAIDTIPKKQMDLIQKKLSNKSTMNQTEIQQLSTRLKNIESVNSEIAEYQSKLMHFRQIYKNELLKAIENIKSAKNNGYIRFYNDEVKHHDYYGNNLSVTHDAKNIKIIDNSNFFYFLNSCIDDNQTSSSCYAKLPTMVVIADHSTIFRKYVGFNLHFRDICDISFVDRRGKEFVKESRDALAKVIFDFKLHINKYAQSISNYCENTDIFAYDDVQACKNEIYEPIKNLDY